MAFDWSKVRVKGGKLWLKSDRGLKRYLPGTPSRKTKLKKLARSCGRSTA